MTIIVTKVKIVVKLFWMFLIVKRNPPLYGKMVTYGCDMDQDYFYFLF